MNINIAAPLLNCFLSLCTVPFFSLMCGHSVTAIVSFGERRHEHVELKDFRMTRLTFGVSASSFAVSMAVRTNAVQNNGTHPRAALAVEKSFHVDDGLTGTDSVSEVITLQKELQHLTKASSFELEIERA